MIIASKMMLRALIVSIAINAVAGQETSADRGPNSELGEVRAIVERLLGAIGRKDFDGAKALWSERSPNRADFLQTLQQRLATEDLSYLSLRISRGKVEADKAAVRAVFVESALHLKTQQKRETSLARAVEVIREAGEWRIWRFAPAANDLADALAKASTEEQRNALLTAEKDLVTPELVQTLSGLGELLVRNGDYKQAISVCQIAHEIGARIDDKTGVARALNTIGAVHGLLGEFDEAMRFHRESLAISEASRNRAGIAKALRGTGMVNRQRGDSRAALEDYRRSLAINEELGDAREISAVLSSIAIIFETQGNSEQALTTYKRSLALSESTGDKRGLARTLHNVGLLLANQGSYVEAMESYRRSLAISESIGEKTGMAHTLLNMASMHSWQNHQQAMDHAKKSLAIAQELGNKVVIAAALRVLGDIHGLGGDYRQALAYLQKSLTMQRSMKDGADIHNTLHSIGEAYLGAGNDMLALAFFRKSLTAGEGLGARDGMASSLVRIAETYVKQGRYQEALAAADRGAALSRESNAMEWLWQARVAAGQVYRATSRLPEARLAFEDAIGTIEEIRRNVAGAEHEQHRYFAGRVYAYHSMVELLVAQNKLPEALTFAERAKSRALLDVLHRGGRKITKAMTEEEKATEQDLRTQLVSLNKQIARESARSQPDHTLRKDLDSRLRKTRGEYEAFENTLYATHPELRVQRGHVAPLRIEDTSALLSDTRTAVLEFVVNEGKTLLFVLTKGASVDIEVFRLPISEADLTERIGQFRRLLANADSRFASAARELYDLVLQPAAALLAGKHRLIVVPDGPLWELPVQALRNPQGHYVLEGHAVFYVPSLTVLREIVRSRGTRPKTSEGTTVLAFANPALGKEAVARVKAVFMDESLDPLPEAEEQVRALQRMYGARVTAYVGPDAREDRFKAESGKHQVLHLATHGIMNDRSPMYSHLLLAQPGDASKEDGLLEAWELMNLDLKADLAVLSACETGRGRVGKGEGMIGLAWALFVAGVRTTAVSQWKVRSDSTANLMVEFHRQLRARSNSSGGIGAAEALRAAALEVKSDPRYRHPFHWAGFIVVGDGY
jgi:CHAT domain-containing protein/Tfp pilus assembly protein PilF